MAQGIVDWQAVKNAVIDGEPITGVIIRATQGIRESKPVGVDSMLAKHITGAASVGLPVGVYHAFIPYRDPVDQAQFFAESIAPYRASITLGYAIDAELSYGMSKDVITERLYVLTQELATKHSITPDIYTSLNFWTSYITTAHDDHFGSLRLWLAAWGAKQPILPHGFKSIWLHQYTSEGRVPGITNVKGELVNVDMNRLYDNEAAATFALVYPVAAPVGIAQPFGVNNTGVEDFYTKWGFPAHEGVDFKGKAGDPIYAVLDGKVKLIGKDDGKAPYGNQIRITSEVNGVTYEHIYAHLQGFVPELVAGSEVRAGQKIGFMGNSGNVIGGGVHLHFSLKKQGATAAGDTTYAKDVIDPTPYFKAA